MHRLAKGVLTAALLALLASPTQAALLLGTGTLNVADDLTRIDDNGTVLEFLDLTFTGGQTVAQALAIYANDGFAFATDDDITALLDAFGTGYQFVPFSFADLGATAANRSDFVDFLGTASPTATDASFGWFDTSGSGGFPSTYLCMSITRCTPNSFVVNVVFDPPNPLIGVFLVRSSTSAPEPTTLLLLGGGLLGLLGYNSRRPGRQTVSHRR